MHFFSRDRCFIKHGSARGKDRPFQRDSKHDMCESRPQQSSLLGLLPDEHSHQLGWNKTPYRVCFPLRNQPTKGRLTWNSCSTPAKGIFFLRDLRKSDHLSQNRERTSHRTWIPEDREDIAFCLVGSPQKRVACSHENHLETWGGGKRKESEASNP